MCTTKTQLLYGIPVRSWELAVAAQVWPRFRRQLHGIDLIRLRKRKGNLQVESKARARANVADLPMEVWSIVRRHARVTEREMDKAARKLITSCCAPDGWKGFDWPDCDRADCYEDSCVDAWIQWSYGGIQESFKDINSLLEYYSLAMVDAPMALKATSQEGNLDAGGFSVVHLLDQKSSGAQGESRSLDNAVEHDGPSRSRAAYVDLSRMVVPFNADRRFRSFMADFDLDVVDDKLPTLGGSAVVAESIEREDESVAVAGADKKKIEEGRKVVEAKWMLWNSTEDCQ